MTELTRRTTDWGLFFLGLFAASRGFVYSFPNLALDRLPRALEALPSDLLSLYVALWWLVGLAACTAALRGRLHVAAGVGIFVMCMAWVGCYLASFWLFDDRSSINGVLIYVTVGFACLLGRRAVQHFINMGTS